MFLKFILTNGNFIIACCNDTDYIFDFGKIIVGKPWARRLV